MDKAYNFYAGPAILPQEVIEEASRSALSFTKDNLSILEISHRSAACSSIFEEAEELIAELLELTDDYKVLFLTGGASSQFYMAPLNLLDKNETCGFINTGVWSKKAIIEANLYTKVIEVASSADKNFTYIPKQLQLTKDLKYLHYTSNNTIHGTQFKDPIDTDIPLIADMSSDIFSKPIDIAKHSLIYAGAQKNLGPSGVTLVIVKKSCVSNQKKSIPTMLNYDTHIAKSSTFNTPPVFPIYVCLLTLRWLKKQGGLKAMEAKNDIKAKQIYDEIDNNPLFYGTAKKEDRSTMNVCFMMHNEDLVHKFLNYCAEKKCVGLKGHRSVGGLRASIYNAMPNEGVSHLVRVMQNFKRMHA